MTVYFEDLCDGTNFKDKVFQDAVREFMASWMPSFPMGLLSTEYDRWELKPVFSLKPQEKEAYRCSCYSAFETREAAMACAESHGEDEDFEPDFVDVWVVYDEDYGRFYEDVSGEGLYFARGETEGIPCWETEGGAEDTVYDTNQERANERGYGFPWANSWVYRPDDRVDDETLQESGFVVATYCGGEGRWREDETYRLCGIDGGGYSFEGAHFARLYALLHEKKHWKVRTSAGEDYIRMRRLNALEEIYQGVKEGGWPG